MRAHVALTPAEFPDLALDGTTAVVVDVLRATSTLVAACAAGCVRVVPMPSPEAALAHRSHRAGAAVLLAGERGGLPIPGFDLGNSPLEFTPERVGGRVLVLATTNGTAAMLTAARAPAAAAAALTNLGAVAAWALAGARDLTVLCAGAEGGFSLEDAVCAGLLVGRLLEMRGDLVLSDAARAAERLGASYGGRLERLAEDSQWARRLAALGHGPDVAACLRLDVHGVVPVFDGGGIVAGPRGLTGPASGTHTEVRRGGLEPTR